MPRWIELTIFWGVVFFAFLCLMQNESIRIQNRGEIRQEVRIRKTLEKKYKDHTHRYYDGKVRRDE